jgi:lysophospholipase L1-like esterase
MPVRRTRFRLLGALLTALLALGGLALVGGTGPASAATTVKVMPLGDSITGSPGCWRQILWSRLQTTGYTNVDFVGSLNDSTSCGTLYDGDNEGHGGFLATNILSQNLLPGWLSAALPDVVMMHLGTNDVWSSIPTATILTTYSGLVDQMRASNPKMRILVAQILPMNPSGCTTCAQGVIDLNAAIPAWAASKSTAASPITVVDQWTGFNTATDTADGVHPNAAGNQKMSDRFYPPLTAAVDSVSGSTPTVTPTTTSPSATPTTSSPSVTPTPTVTPTKACSATLTVVNAWAGGFIASVRVTAGSSAISRWTVTLTVPSGNSIPNLWNGQLSGTVVSSASWNSAIAAGGSTDFGFQGAGSPTGWGIASCTAS